MILTVLDSGSKANGYILQNDTEAIIIEAGVPIKEAKKALGFNIRKVVGCLVSHSHTDHAGRAREYQDSNINICASMDTAIEADIKAGRLLQVFRHGDTFALGGFTVKAVEVRHDVACFAFLIRHPDIGLMLFATDTFYLPYTFEGLTNIMIEANYSREIVRRNIQGGYIHPSFEKRIIQSHLEITDTIKALQANDLTGVNNIVLLHLSDSNSDADDFRERVQRITGKTVYVAEKGLSIEVNKTPF